MLLTSLHVVKANYIGVNGFAHGILCTMFLTNIMWWQFIKDKWQFIMLLKDSKSYKSFQRTSQLRISGIRYKVYYWNFTLLQSVFWLHKKHTIFVLVGIVVFLQGFLEDIKANKLCVLRWKYTFCYIKEPYKEHLMLIW